MMTEMSSGGGKAVDSIMLVYFGSYVLRIKYVVEMKCIDNMYLWDLTLCFFDLRIK